MRHHYLAGKAAKNQAEINCFFVMTDQQKYAIQNKPNKFLNLEIKSLVYFYYKLLQKYRMDILVRKL